MSNVYVDPNTGLDVLVKKVAEDRAYRMRFSSLLDGASIFTVVSVVSTKQNAMSGSVNVVLGVPTIDGDRVVVQVSGGTAGEHYVLRFTVVDSAGNTLVADGMLYVEA